MSIKKKLSLSFIVINLFILLITGSNYILVSPTSNYQTAYSHLVNLSSEFDSIKHYAQDYVTFPEKSAVTNSQFDNSQEEITRLIGQLEPLLETAEEKSILSDISGKNIDLKNFFDKIRKSPGMRVAYSQNIFDKAINVGDKRREFRDAYLGNAEYIEILTTPVTYTFKGKQSSHTIKWGYNYVQYHEKLYLWEFRETAHDSWLDAVDEFRAIVDASSLNRRNKEIVRGIFSEYKDLTEDAVEFLNPNDIIFLGLQKTKLSEAIEDKRDKIKTNYLENPSYADIVDRGITYTFKDKQRTDTLYSVFLLMAHFDRGYLWQYMDNNHYEEWLESAENFRAILRASRISRSDKSVIFNLLEEYINLVGRGRKLVNRIETATIQYKGDIAPNVAIIESIVHAIQFGNIQDDMEGLDYLSALLKNKVENQLNESINYGLIIGSIAILLSYVIGANICRSITNSVTELRNTALEIAEGNLDKMVKVTTKDELGELAGTFNKMNRKLKESLDQLVQKERLATLGQLTSIVSHEIRNPLGTIRNSLFSVRERLRGKEPGVEQALARADRSVTRCDNIIGELLDYTRIRDLNLESTIIDKWISDLLDEQSIPEGISLDRKLTAGVEIPIDRERLRRCMINILNNAADAITSKDGRGTDEERLTVETRIEEESLKIKITDTGHGLNHDQLKKVFEPLFSTKSFGVGLGLSIAGQIMQQHGGGIGIESVPGSGTTVTLWLPVNREWLLKKGVL